MTRPSLPDSRADAAALPNGPSAAPAPHAVRSERALYDYVCALKNQFMRSAPSLAKVVFDKRLQLTHQALGTHTQVSRVQGGRLTAKREIRIAAIFKDAPEDYLRMIVVHELAHLKERTHDRAFYALCCHMEPDYHRLELGVRRWLASLEPAPAQPSAPALRLAQPLPRVSPTPCAPAEKPAAG